MPSHTNTAVQLFGNYFVDTGHIIARLTVEDGTVSIVNVTYVNPQTLQLNIPPHNVPMLWVGLEVTVEVSHEAVDPSISLNQRLWQIVASETNSIDSAIRLHYYGKFQRLVFMTSDVNVLICRLLDTSRLSKQNLTVWGNNRK